MEKFEKQNATHTEKVLLLNKYKQKTKKKKMNWNYILNFIKFKETIPINISAKYFKSNL